MSKEFYFFEQYSHSFLHRSKRNSKDFNQALTHAKTAIALSDEHSVNSDTSFIDQTIKSTPLKKPISPENLTKQLDSLLKTFDEISQENSNDDFQSTSSIPKVSLPAQLIIQLNSSWQELIKDTNYQSKIWRTKTGEDSWRRYVQMKNNPEKAKEISREKSTSPSRRSSRMSILSTSTFSHRPSIINNQRQRSSRSYSRGSISVTNQDPLRLIKTTKDNPIETIKNGIHVQFRLSKKDQIPTQKIVSFDITKTNVNTREDLIIAMQNKCKQLLIQAKQKIYQTNSNEQNGNRCQIRFYEDNQSRNVLSAATRRSKSKSKFAISILRHEIPEKFNVDLNTIETKRKCSIELPDGTIQIYYPSGRLAVLRFGSSKATTLFFDDTPLSTHQFLGVVTSTGNVLLVEPTLHARFIANNRREIGYLCHGKSGVIEKEFLWNSSSIPLREKSYPSVIDHTLQLQINSSMQFEYHNPSKISFAFQCQNEQFHYQLAVQLPRASTSMMTKNTSISKEKTSPMLFKRSNSIISNSDQSKPSTRSLSNEKPTSRSLTPMDELILLRKRIEHLCESWLEECRTTLGILHIDAYHLPDYPLPSSSTVTQTQPKIIEKSRSSNNTRFLTQIDRQKYLLTHQFQRNVIAETIERYLPRSDQGLAMKQRIYEKNLLPNLIEVIK